MAAELQVSTTAGIARVVMSNPERRNALTFELKQKLIDVFRSFDCDPEIRCIVLTGAGKQAFTAGSDMSEFAQHRLDPQSEANYVATTTAAMYVPALASKPVIASVRGACMGAGLQLALACDVRIASSAAYFAMPGARLGMGYPYATTSMIVSLLGRGRASDLLMSARRFTAEEALDLGLINRIVRDEELDDAVSSYAQTVAANAPLTLKLVKESIRTLSGIAPVSNPPHIQKLADACMSSQDFQEGRAASREKRQPAFQGR